MRNLCIVTDPKCDSTYCIFYLWISPEGPDVDLARADGTNRVDDDGDEGLLVILVEHLGGHIDARQPAAVPRVTVVPADHVLLTANLTDG